MTAKFIITNSPFHKSNITTKKSKFIIYKDNNNLNHSIAQKQINVLNSKQISKFKVTCPNYNPKLKVLKSHKFVYSKFICRKENLINSSIIDKKIIRRSGYRGVSKNGSKWQVSLMKNKMKCYLGNFQSEKIAAKIYDFFEIQLRANKAITNFFHDK